MDNTKIVESLKTQEFCYDIKKPNQFGVRHVQSILQFFGIIVSYFLRDNISAAIVPMTQPTAGQPYYNWNSSQKSLILSSFYWGYVVAQMPTSLLSKRFGAKIVFAVATIMDSIVTIFHPLAAQNGSWQLVCGLRVLVGITQGAVYTCTHDMLAKWAPRPERSILGTFVYSGAQLGIAVMLVSSGSIFVSNIGWPGLFYISGGLGLIWSAIYLFFAADAPKDSKVISLEEQEYIEALTGSAQQSESLVIPWKSIFTSLPFYGLLAAHSAFSWGFYTLQVEMPTYMNSVLHLDVKSNALFSSIPHFLMLVMGYVFAPLSDMLINRQVISVTVARKLFNSICQWIPMLCLIALGYMTEETKIWAIVLFTISLGFGAAVFCGYFINHVDLSPNFAGTLMGLTNGFANICSICAPLVVGAIVQNEDDPGEWRIVFFIAAAIFLVCNLLFIIFGKGTVQPWNNVNVGISTTTLLTNNVEEINVTAVNE